MSGADAVYITRRGEKRRLALVLRGLYSLLPPHWSAAHLAVNESIIFFFWDKSQPTPRYGLPTVTMINPFISCNKPAGEVIYPRFAGELYTCSVGRRHRDEALRDTETLSHTGGREDAKESRKSPSISDDSLSISCQNPIRILLAGAQAQWLNPQPDVIGPALPTFGWRHELGLFFFPPLSPRPLSRSASSITEWRHS